MKRARASVEKIIQKRARGALLFWLALLWLTTLSGQADRVRFQKLTVSDGLSDQYINCVFQDSRGFLWIGTANGLNRYDGYQFTVFEYDPLDPRSLSSNWVRVVEEDENGHIWVGTESGLNRLDPRTGKFRRYFHDEDDPNSIGHDHIYALHKGPGGRLWAGTKAAGLHRYDPAADNFEYYRYYTGAPSPDDAVKSILEDEKGKLWLGAWNNGLYHFDPATGESVHYTYDPHEEGSLPGNAVWSVFKDSRGRLWVGTYNRGLSRLDAETGVFTNYRHIHDGPESLSHDGAWAICEGRQGQLWIGTNGGGINLFDPETGAFQHFHYEPDSPYSLSNDAVRAVMLSRDGLLWAGTNSGLNYFSPRAGQFQLYQKEPSNGLSSNAIWSLHQYQPGYLWVGAFDGVVHRLDLASGRFESFSYEEKTVHSGLKSPVYALQGSRDGGLWIGTFGDGLHYLPQGQGEPLHFRDAGKDTHNLSSSAILSLYEDADGVLWVGAYNGLSRLDKGGKQFRHITGSSSGEDNRSDDAVWDIMESRDGYLWLATNGGLKRFDRRTEAFRQYLHDPSNPQSLSYNAVRTVYEDSRGWIWAGARNGLNRLLPDTENFVRYYARDGLPGNTIYGILEDGNGRMWISTTLGLSCLDTDTGQFRNFDAHDGLQGASFNVGAYCKSPFSGMLFFGGDNGFNAFDPRDIQVDSLPPPVAITAIQAFRPGEQEASRLIRQLDKEQELQFSWRDNILTFEFAALSFSKPDKNRYSYKLEGLSSHWVPLGGENKVAFTNLAPGLYTFQVKGSNGDGVWNEEGATVRFTIMPPWWKTMWAKGFYLLAVAAMLWLLYRWRTQAQRRRIRQQQKELGREKQVSERLRQIDRLKDQFLANTSHELRTPLQGIIGLSEGLYSRAADPESREDLSMVISSGRRLNSLINDILDFSKLRNFDLELNRRAVELHVLAEVVLRNNRPLIRGKNLQLINAVPENLPTANGDENRLQQVLYNLVGNAIKFTEQGHIRVGAKLKEVGAVKMLEMFVEDSGIGIPEDKREVIFQEFEQGDGSITREFAGTGLGLSISRRLVELHGGSMRLESETGKGSTFFFTLPVSGEKASSELANRPVPEVSHVLPSASEADNGKEKKNIPGIHHGAISEADKIRILVVDDEPVNQQVLKNHLSSGLYELVQAMNGEEAMRCIESGQAFDLVLLDVMMPRMSGYEVCQKIREKHLPSELPVIMVTAKNQVEDLVQGLSLGANDYLAKPFSREEFLARIQTHIDLHRIFDVTERFIPNEFIRSLGRQRITEVELGDFAEREVTVFFSDIRDYTSLAETMTPEQNYRFVNAYNGRMGPIIQKNKGFVNQYLGDAIMSIFTESAADALRAAIEMQQTLRIYNAERRSKGRTPVRIGAGLHSGPLIMGIIGDRRRMDAATISDTVNTASRIENLTKHFGAFILLSEDSLQGIPDKKAFNLRYLGQVRVKGKREAVGIYECFDGDPPQLIEQKQATLALFREGRKHYLAGNFREAMEAFEEVLRASPDDATTQLRLNRIAHYLTHGKPEGWTGVELMEEK